MVYNKINLLNKYMDNKQLLEDINKVHDYKTHIEMIIGTISGPVLNIYTTGLADGQVCFRWDKYVNEWFKKELAAYSLNIIHYDKGFEDIKTIQNKCKPNNGIMIDQYLDFKPENFNKPYVIFDFAHVITNYHTDSLKNNALYILYENSTYDPFFEYSLNPFIIKNGVIKTYIQQLIDKEYTIEDIKYSIAEENLKPGKSNEVPFKTIRFQNILFDIDKLGYLYRLIIVFDLKTLARALNIKESRDAFIANTKVDAKLKFQDNMNDIIQLIK